MTLPNIAYPIVIPAVTQTRGDAFGPWKLLMNNSDNTPANLSTAFGPTWTAQLRTTADAETAIDFTVDVTHITAGYLLLSLTGTQTAAMRAGSTYLFDVQASGGSVTPWTVWSGRMVITADITRP